MTVGELKKYLEGVPDDADVIVPTGQRTSGGPCGIGASHFEHNVCTRDILACKDLEKPEHYVFIRGNE